MSLVQQALLQPRWQPILQFVRYRRINYKRPRLPHYDRKLVLHVCQPIYEKNTKSMQELCLKRLDTINTKPENPLRTLLGREVLNWFNNSNTALFFHCNHMTQEDIFKAKVLFKRQNMSLRFFDNDVIQEGLAGSRYEPVLHLYKICRGPIAFSSEPKVSEIIKINKKLPQLLLLCGIIDNRLLNKEEVMEYTKFPDLQSAQAQLVSVLNSAGTGLVNKINEPQTMLVNHLEKHIELQNTEDVSNTEGV